MTENKNAKTPTDDGHVAHVYLFEKTGRPMVAWDNAKDIKLGDRLYTAPKQWVGLTDEERHNIREWQEIQKELGPVWAPMMLYLYLAIEQALKEKNQ